MGTPPKDTPTEIQILDIKAILDAGAERPLLQSFLEARNCPRSWNYRRGPVNG